MTYTVLARRYRSQDFGELVGQNAIAQTLQAAIAQGRVAHAYLFTGTRGVGKTSSARIFANALNNPKNDPEIRGAIMGGRDTDTIEIDAASNSKVEETRELIANAVYRPLRGHKKVYIIDECHMLSAAAFNALLKTMEEPPEHVVFILCTTETHKVPATIQSRCQRFDFRNIPVAQIAGHLSSVCKQEKIDADDELLHMVARLANGSMRDSLSLLDRLIAAGRKRLTPELLEELLGLPDRTVVAELVDALAEANAAGALERAHTLLSRGTSGETLMTTLAERFRDLMALNLCGSGTELVELTGEARDQAIEQSRRFDGAALVHMIALCESVSRNAKSCSFPRALVDALMVRLAFTEKFADVTAVLTGGGSAPMSGARPAGAPAGAAMAGAGAGAKKR
ncbi:MAG: DNA polymerase III subunit gamma/tau [Phycisphaerales bacterium]|nr:DNA polymerase III subunit gamma/tau [Phycisphaerales bacterium]